jgi:hypothetical protein
MVIWSVAAALIAPAHASDLAAARAFVEKIYASYADNATPSPLGADAPSLFAAPLLALIREDQRRANGEAGLLDYDPLCGCQDFNHLRVTATTFKALDAGRLRATVHLVNSGERTTIGLILVPQKGEWRIADVQNPGVPSLTRFLKTGLASAASNRPRTAAPPTHQPR